MSVRSSSHTLITNGVITPPQSSQEVSIFDRVSSWASTLDYHDGLTALSVVPFVGGVAGTADALSYVYNGEYSTAATMFALGFIPGGKLGMKIVGTATKELHRTKEIYTYQTKIRKAKGSDGATSETIQELLNGKTNSMIHRVTKNGDIIHQHQTHIGKYGAHRQFNDNWTGTTTINAPYPKYKPSEWYSYTD